MSVNPPTLSSAALFVANPYKAANAASPPLESPVCCPLITSSIPFIGPGVLKPKNYHQFFARRMHPLTRFCLQIQNNHQLI